MADDDIDTSDSPPLTDEFSAKAKWLMPGESASRPTVKNKAEEGGSQKMQSIKKPPCPLDEHNFRGCLAFVGEQLTYYINRRCKADLLWLFWSCCAEWSYYEDPSLENDFYPKLTSQENWVPYCETTVVKEADKVRRGEDYPNGYRRLSERLDFYVTKPEFAEAYHAIQQLGRRQGNAQITETVIFGSLRVVLLANADFGERAEIGPSTGLAGL